MEDRASIETRAMGVYYRRQDGGEFTVRNGDALEARRDPENPYDENAISLHVQDGERIGWVARYLSEGLAPLMDAGRLLSVRVRLVEDTSVWITLVGGAVDDHQELARLAQIAAQARHDAEPYTENPFL